MKHRTERAQFLILYSLIVLLSFWGCGRPEKPEDSPRQTSRLTDKADSGSASATELQDPVETKEAVVEEALREELLRQEDLREEALSLEAANKVKEAEELFGKLRAWQDAKDWEIFFENKDSYRTKIEELLKDVDFPLHLRLKARYLYFEVSSFLGQKDKKCWAVKLAFGWSSGSRLVMGKRQ